MILPIIPLYTVLDFLIDQKTELKRLSRLLKKTKCPERCKEIKELQEHLYNQGLQAIYRFKREIPECLKNYYLGLRGKPEMSEISSELRRMNHGDNHFNRRLIKTVVIATITILCLISLFF